MNMKDITVIIRTYNSAAFVKKAIDSALNQTLNKKFYEILVVDDGSADTTLDILKNNYGNEIKIIKQKHLGASVATNNGILKSRGQYIILLDSDDEFLPDILKKMFSEFKKNNLIDFVYCDYFETLQPGSGQEKKKKVSLKNNIFKTIATAILFKKKLFNEIGFYDKKFFFAEYDFLIKLIKSKKIGKHIPVPLYVYVRNKNSLTSNLNAVKTGIAQLKEKYGNIAEKIRKY